MSTVMRIMRHIVRQGWMEHTGTTPRGRKSYRITEAGRQEVREAAAA